MDLGKSLREIFQAPVRFMKESLEKESVFEKPYLSGGYREMHYKPPGPDGEKPKPIQYPDCGTLICTERGECDFAVAMWKLTDWSPPLPRGYPDKGTWTVEGSECDGVSCFDYIMSYFDSVTLALGQGTLDGGPGIRFKINPEGAIPDETDKSIGHCYFHIRHKTEWGAICDWEWSIQCPLKCTEFNLVVLCHSDDVQLGYGSACDTVAREACATVYVGGEVGGEPEYPSYTWTITGTGFHFDAVDGPTTKTTPTAASLVLICADDTACGTGTVTVTDACGNTGTDYIRCDEGAWVRCYNNNQVGSHECWGGVCSDTFIMAGHDIHYEVCEDGEGGGEDWIEAYCEDNDGDGWGGIINPSEDDPGWSTGCNPYTQLTKFAIYFWTCS